MRQLTSLGFKLAPKLQAAAESAQRFYRHGLVLRQVAAFYNEIGTQILACQKPMLLQVGVEGAGSGG